MWMAGHGELFYALLLHSKVCRVTAQWKRIFYAHCTYLNCMYVYKLLPSLCLSKIVFHLRLFVFSSFWAELSKNQSWTLRSKAIHLLLDAVLASVCSFYLSLSISYAIAWPRLGSIVCTILFVYIRCAVCMHLCNIACTYNALKNEFESAAYTLHVAGHVYRACTQCTKITIL